MHNYVHSIEVLVPLHMFTRYDCSSRRRTYLLVNDPYPSGSSSAESTRAVALVDKLPGSLEVKLTAGDEKGRVCV